MLQLPCTTADPEEYKLVCSDFYFGKIYITLFLCSCSHMIKFIIYTQPLRAVHILNINIHIFTSPDSSFTEATNIHQTLFIQDKVEKSLKQEQDRDPR